GASQLVFVFNFFRGVFTGAKAEQNPWGVGTLEWTHATSPPVHHNYDQVPEVFHGPHEFSDPVVREALHKDWLGQAEPYPGKKSSGEKSAHG
ncbi:MAG: cytochrome-c oxidase, partial [Chloroflexota bacterium]